MFLLLLFCRLVVVVVVTVFVFCNIHSLSKFFHFPPRQSNETVPLAEVRETGAVGRFRFSAKIWINENSESDKSRESRDIACLLDEQATGTFMVSNLVTVSNDIGRNFLGKLYNGHLVRESRHIACQLDYKQYEFS